MKQHRVSFAGILTLVVLLASQASVLHAQPHGSDCNCHKQKKCSQIWSCLWGRMVSDGTGGSFRQYGYPRHTCCGNQPHGYPIWGMGGTCLHGCRHHDNCPPEVYQR
ncbi:hypothetical protein [Schlesneria sp. T3-172]|uniref:hypothetical protein n=1 Tax=Schlesneria TaxID=656899 RepID=UPI002EDD249A